jgi:hypothetical protein
MSRLLYDFLSESFLFDDERVNAKYEGISAEELERELESYRKHAIQNLDRLREHLSGERSELSIYFDTAARASPPVPLLKQSLLYYDRAILDDPLFRETHRQGPAQETVSRFLGHRSGEADRERVAKAASFMKQLTPMVAGDFLYFAPISLLHEPPETLVLTASEALFEERVPASLREFFAKRARVQPLERMPGGGWRSNPKSPLGPTRSIVVGFDDYPQPYIYQLLDTKVLSFDEATGVAQIDQTLPDAPPSEEQFRAWLTQSINQSAGDLLRRTEADVMNAVASGSLLLTNSGLVADLLTEGFRASPPTPETEIARLAMNLELPIVQEAGIGDLMRVRVSEGEAFDAFRLALKSKLREMRHVSDAETLKAKIQDYQHELEQVQVPQLGQQIARLKREFMPDIGVGLASLMAAVLSPNATLMGVLVAGFSAAQKAVRYVNTKTQNPAFFLWKLKKEAGRKSQ